MTEPTKNYQQQKMDFLDSLEPNDFRNGGSFNQAEIIIDELNNALHHAVSNQENPEEFMHKALTNLFRENSPAIAKATDLFGVYLEFKNQYTQSD